jgi:hypothetical protein
MRTGNTDIFLKVFAHFHRWGRRIRIRPSSLRIWFLLLLSLNVSDIFTTVPDYEANPLTLYTWERLGFFPAACLKIGLVLSFGLLCVAAWKVANPNDWKFSKKMFLGILKALVVFYVFVVAINVFISTI